MAETSTEARLARLEALEEIRTKISVYALGGDRFNDPDILGPLFTEDAVWDAAGFGRYDGRAAILEGLSKIAQDTILWSLHFPTGPIIRIADDGKEATAFWWLWELATVQSEPGKKDSSFLGGTYDAKLRFENGEWLFYEVNLQVQTIAPFKDGWQLVNQKTET